MMNILVILFITAQAQSTKDLARRSIASHMPALQGCFLPDLQRDPALAVELKLKWTIDEDGAVLDAKVLETTKKLDNFEKCMLMQIQKVKFEPEGIKYDFEYVFKFKGAKS